VLQHFRTSELGDVCVAQMAPAAWYATRLRAGRQGVIWVRPGTSPEGPRHSSVGSSGVHGGRPVGGGVIGSRTESGLKGPLSFNCDRHLLASYG
jgi:hypothetical protein